MVQPQDEKIKKFSPGGNARMGNRTLQDIMGSVGRDSSLREARRREILSALRKVAECIGRQPSEITALPASALQKQLAKVNYLQAGLTQRRWINIRSLTSTALRLCGANIMPSRWTRSEYSQGWKTLRAVCSSYHRIGLSRFMNFCSSNGIEPGQVDAAVFEAFRQALETQSIVPKPAQAYRAACRLWDSAGGTVPKWPPFRMGLKATHQTYSLEWSAFPGSFQEDVEAFLSYGGDRDILSDDYAPSVRPATTLNRRKSIRQMATALVKSGLPAERITSLAVLVKPDNAKTILSFFLDRAGGAPKDSTYSVACLLRTIANTWVKNDADLPTIDRFRRALGHEVVKMKKRGMKDRNRQRLRQFDNERNVSALLHLPNRLIQLARQQDTGGESAMTFAMYGTAIEVLCVAPIRIKNLVSLKIGENIILPADRKKGRVLLWIPDDQTKNGAPIEIRLPLATSHLILNYLEEFRPRISATPSDWLFPSPRGERRNIVGFGAQISKLIRRHTGLEMHPHLFRHLSLKFLEQDDPNSAEIGRRLLAHRSINTTLNSYSEGKNDAAYRHFENVIESRRSGTSKKSESYGS